MKLLLLLSALLSALVGGPLAATRTPVAPPALSQAITAQKLLAVPTTIPDRPDQRPTLMCRMAPDRCITIPLPPATPIYASRRRE